jgi:nitronate monooxygenase
MFLVSGPDLVVEACRQGVIGTFPALNQRTSEGYEQWLSEKRGWSATWRSPVRHRVPLVITSLGAARKAVDAGVDGIIAVAAGAGGAVDGRRSRLFGSAVHQHAGESGPEGFKEMIVTASAEDIVYTDAISGVHANFLRASTVAAGGDPENLPADSGLRARGRSFTAAGRAVPFPSSQFRCWPTAEHEGREVPCLSAGG